MYASIRTPRLFPEWEIREYRNGTYDVAHKTEPTLSPGFDTFEAAYAWLLDLLAGDES